MPQPPLFGREGVVIECIHRNLRIVIDDNGNQGTILSYYNTDGDDCEPGDAVACVAECAGKFYAINLKDYEDVFSN